MSDLAPNQFAVGSEVWTVTEDDDGTLRATAPGREAVAFMTESGSFPEQLAALCAKLGPWFHAKGKAEGAEETFAKWQRSLDECEALAMANIAKEALAS